MRLKVQRPVIVAHKARYPGETFEVSDSLARYLLDRHAEALAPEDVTLETLSDPEPDTEPLPPLTDLGLSRRVLDALDFNGIRTAVDLWDVFMRGDEAVLDLHGIGPQGLAEIKEALEVVE